MRRLLILSLFFAAGLGCRCNCGNEPVERCSMSVSLLTPTVTLPGDGGQP